MEKEILSQMIESDRIHLMLTSGLHTGEQVHTCVHTSVTPPSDSSPLNEGTCFLKSVVMKHGRLPHFEKLLSSGCLGDIQIEMPSHLLDV